MRRAGVGLIDWAVLERDGMPAYKNALRTLEMAVETVALHSANLEEDVSMALRRLVEVERRTEPLPHPMCNGDLDAAAVKQAMRPVNGNGRVTDPEPAPVPNGYPAVWELVMGDMRQRDAGGRAKYGTPLQPFNGRDALTDAYQEALDLVVYLRQYIYERDVLAGTVTTDDEVTYG